MRIYRAEKTGATFIDFRYTTPEGESIHEDRQLANCQFLPGGCYGKVGSYDAMRMLSSMHSQSTPIVMIIYELTLSTHAQQNTRRFINVFKKPSFP